MIARKIQTQSSVEILQRLVPQIAEAAAGHDAVESPAVLLQRRLDAAIAASSVAGAEAEVGRWPGVIRLSILAGGAAASWAVVLAVARALA